MSDPKRSSNISALNSRSNRTHRERDRDLEGLSDSDVELVIQKNNEGPTDDIAAISLSRHFSSSASRSGRIRMASGYD
jgi:hypothetical protein